MSQEEPKSPASVYDHLVAIIDQMAAVSWQKLGLQPDILTGKVERDLAEAKVAIDLTAYIAGLLDAKLDDSDRRQLQGLVRDLRINFVEKSKEAEA